MKNKLLVTAALAIIFIAFNYLNSQSSNNAVVENKKAPDFELISTNGKKIKLSDFKNKIVIIDFWATWCGPCRRGIPDLVSIQNEFKKDVAVIGISLDRDTKSEVVPFMKKYGINYPIVYGDDAVVKSYGGIEAIPTSFIIDKKGNIVDNHVGLVSKSTYTDLIKSLIKVK